jgi:hypothetical protein
MLTNFLKRNVSMGQAQVLLNSVFFHDFIGVEREDERERENY